MSAGSIGTPQILKLSGIGDSAELSPLHIQTIINNPSVGENLSDHTLLPNIFTVSPTASTLDNFLRDPTDVNDAVQQWVQNKTGPFANNVVNTFGFSRLPANSTIFKTTPDPAPGPNSPHWELILSVSACSAKFLAPSEVFIRTSGSTLALLNLRQEIS